MDSFKDFEKDLVNLAKTVKEGSKSFLKKQGKKLQKETVKIAKLKTKEHTGKYIKSIKNGKIYDFKGNISTRVYSVSPHAHLIEYGHKIVTRSGKVKGYKKGEYVFETAQKNFQKEFEENMESFINEACKKNNL